MPSCSTSMDSSGQPEQLFTCTVCRKVFKREMNLIFHMTTHRPRQPQAESSEPTSTQPVKCQDCNKEFATKYQAKKHYLRRHFQGDKPFACTKCNKKRFVVKEDLTMHMKSCGNVYVCTCGIRLCSLGALKRHCKYFSHEPESYEPKPEPGMAQVHNPINLPLDWSGGAPGFRGPQMQGQPSGETQQRDDGSNAALLMNSALQQRMEAGALQQRMEQQNYGAGGGDDPMNVCSHAAVMRSMMGQGAPAANGQPMAGVAQQGWQPELFQGMPLSLVHALRQAHAEQQPYGMQQHLSGMPDQAAARAMGYQAMQYQQHSAAALSAVASAAYATNTPVSSAAAAYPYDAYAQEAVHGQGPAQ